jgi:hypothetical protein
VAGVRAGGPLFAVISPVTHVAAGSVAGAAGVICLSYQVYGWAAFFLVLGALHIGGGYWYLTIDRSASAGT